ncbi:helix-turn-helix transcriptional regulator [Thalassotalea ponticola]|uniref:helix-turn-helix transcriptional regulator n=1 Tax=Thalassotalea ponticola TaxID=1523392 RepID=UPI0025B44842|nr:helix-turn-helix transcriptional regulator [Thalassotalea ponticola]MDN3653447.1 helix-turn-helix transcriptional regulator [Thalassotalea ponticola]
MAVKDLCVAEYDDILGLLYDAAIDESSWGEPLNHIRKALNANYITLILKSPQAEEDDDLGMMIFVGDNDDGDGYVKYHQYQHNLTPFRDCEPDKVFTVSDVMPMEKWEQSTYFKHWLPDDVYYVLSTDISTGNSGRLRFRATRAKEAGDFSDSDKAFCQQLIPHLRRALNIHNQIDRSYSLGVMYTQAIGRMSTATLLIDEHGHVIDKNVYAQEILDRKDGLRITNGVLEACSGTDNKRLKELMKHAFTESVAKKSDGLPEAMSISRNSSEVKLGVVIEPIPSTTWATGYGQPTAVVYVRDSESKSRTSADIAKKLFDLTPAETALSMQLTNGLSLEEAAEELGIRRNTARAHLRSIFSKTGVRRQTELVRLFLNSVASLGFCR